MLVGHHPFCGSILEKPAFQAEPDRQERSAYLLDRVQEEFGYPASAHSGTASLGWIAQYTLTMLTQVDKLEFLVLVDNCKSVSSQMPRLIHSIGQA